MLAGHCCTLVCSTILLLALPLTASGQRCFSFTGTVTSSDGSTWFPYVYLLKIKGAPQLTTVSDSNELKFASYILTPDNYEVRVFIGGENAQATTDGSAFLAVIRDFKNIISGLNIQGPSIHLSPLYQFLLRKQGPFAPHFVLSGTVSMFNPPDLPTKLHPSSTYRDMLGGLGGIGDDFGMFHTASTSCDDPAPEPALNICDTCTAIAEHSASAEDFQRSWHLCNMLTGALKELSDYRTSFLKYTRFANLFPTVYYNVTQIEMRRLAAGDFVHPVEKMEQMVAFFEAFQWNRANYEMGMPVEPHWDIYYQMAGQADATANAIPLLIPELVANVMGSGVAAHVDYDLPRALRHSFSLRSTPPVTLHPDFLRTEKTLDQSFDVSQTDIISAFEPTHPLIATGIQLMTPVIPFFLPDVVEKRNTAWNIGTANDVLPTGSTTQPFLTHHVLERKGNAYCSSVYR